jgi:hypothetical protein
MSLSTEFRPGGIFLRALALAFLASTASAELNTSQKAQINDLAKQKGKFSQCASVKEESDATLEKLKACVKQVKEEATLSAKASDEDVTAFVKTKWTAFKDVRETTKTQTSTTPTHTDLTESFSIKEQPDVRAEVAKFLGITDKGHATHGANFTSPQTLKQIIENLYEPLKTIGADKNGVVAGKCIKYYKFDPRS